MKLNPGKDKEHNYSKILLNEILKFYMKNTSAAYEANSFYSLNKKQKKSKINKIKIFLLINMKFLLICYLIFLDKFHESN